MNLNPSPRHWALVAGLAVAGLTLQACAGASPSHPAAPTVARPAPKPAQAQMAPIPNPPEDQKAPPPAVATTPLPRPAAKPAAPKISPNRAPAHPPAQSGGPTPPAGAAQAAKLRASGLEQLNRGAIDRAVALLQQASQLDPANDLIRRDLERALRISQAVRAKQ